MKTTKRPRAKVRSKKVINAAADKAEAMSKSRGAPVDPDSLRNRCLKMMQADLSDNMILDVMADELPNVSFKRRTCTYYRSTFSNMGLLKPWQAPKGSKTFEEWFYSREVDWSELDAQ